MKLELEPIEGEKILTEEEKERLKRRTRPIPPDALSRFSDAEKQAIKHFLIKLVVLTEHVDHDRKHEDQFEDHEQHMLSLNQARQALFQNPSPAIANFITLLELCPSEAWKEFEALIAFLREEDLRHYHEAAQKSGIVAATSNTPKEIQELISHYSLEDLVKHLIDARRIISGEFWDEGFYDL